MSKKTNTIWFMVAGTVFNVVVTIILFLLLLFIYARLLSPVLPESTQGWALLVIFVGSICGDFGLYRLAMKIIEKKVDIEAHFDPLFGNKRGYHKPVKKD
jgi:hypothetical protein